MARRRLSERTKGAAPDGPFEGVPAHMQHALVHWFEGVANSGSGGWYSHEQGLRDLAAFLRARVNSSWDAHDLGQGLVSAAFSNDELFLDLVDATLEIFVTGEPTNRALKRLLDLSGSVWTVDMEQKTLVRIVTDEAQATYSLATSVEDEATTELREAWSNAFGRNGDPSDAWGHAIKALEDVLIPLVVPNQDKPNLGHVVGQLHHQGQRWRLVLPGKSRDHDVAPLVGMLDLVWPDHDRHGGTVDKRAPSEQEARAVVTLAATVIQWYRDGWVLQLR